jgi:undecaprenyl diphosphate synthase
MNKNQSNLTHVAIIMDGNARWAQENGLSKIQGHKKGATIIKDIIASAMELEIPYMTLYSFSSENWQRDSKEVAYLLNLLSYYLKNEINALNSSNIRLKVIGRLDLLDPKLQAEIKRAQELTKNNDKLTVYIAFSYGGRSEIVDACQKLINNGYNKVDEALIKAHLYDPDMPDVDLLIRTGGFYRVSNFLLWQIAYAELFFCSKLWPDFNKTDLIEAINDYKARKRNFGTRKRDDGGQCT